MSRAGAQQPHEEVPFSFYNWSVFSALCCLPLGALALKYSKKAEKSMAGGDVLGAKGASESALIYNMLALICGLIIWPFLAYLVLQKRPN